MIVEANRPTLMLSPQTITRRQVMYSRQERKVIRLHLFRLDAELVWQFAHRRCAYTFLISLKSLLRHYLLTPLRYVRAGTGWNAHRSDSPLPAPT
jgi:hypothetical protein